MNINELADCIEFDAPIMGINKEAATMLRQQQAEIEKLGSELDRIVELYTDKAIENEALKKELALQRLSDIGQAIEQEPLGEEFEKVLKDNLWQLYEQSNEDRESAIYATGYWNGIAEGKKQYELYGAVWHDEHGYQFTATVGEKVLNDDRWIKLYRKVEK